MDQSYRVIIVGAGPVGLTAALLLHRRSIPFLLLETNTDLSYDLRASTFHPPTLDMLRSIGIADPLIAEGLISPTWQIRMHPSGERAEFDLSLISDVTDHPYRLQCEQSVLCRILYDRLVAEGCEIRMGMAVVSVENRPDSVRVVAKGTRGENAEFEADYLIGADGSRSVVRKQISFGFEGKTYPETTILATTTFPFEHHLSGLSNVNYVWKEGGTFSLLRLKDLWRCSLYPDAGETIEQALELVSINRKLGEIVPEAADHPLGEVRPYRIHMRLANDYRSGRVLLAGDAAHVNSPSGGMGMNGGIHDVFELTPLLETVLNGGSSALLDRYTRRRRPIAEAEILTQSDRNRARMQERDWTKRREMLSDLQRIADDCDAAREHLLKTSMIAGLRRAAVIQ